MSHREYKKTIIKNMNYYNPECNEEQEKLCSKIYKKLAFKTHPDRSNGNTKLFLDINEANNKKNILKLVCMLKICDLNHIIFSTNELQLIKNEKNKAEQYISTIISSVIYNWTNLSNEEKETYINKTIII